MLVAGATAAGWVGASSSSSSSSGSNWLADTMTAIKNSQTSGGILGALQSAGDGSVSSFLGQSTGFANNFATIAQTSVSSASTFYTQLAAQNQHDQANQALQKAIDALSQSQNMVPAKNVLPSVIYFSDGTTIDTTTNIMTKPNGTQYDVTTGARYVDPSKVIQFGNGSYLDTSTNILTMADGTQIDTVTGLKVSS